jgi:hypothetical protein
MLFTCSKCVSFLTIIPQFIKSIVERNRFSYVLAFIIDASNQQLGACLLLDTFKLDVSREQIQGYKVYIFAIL